MLDVVLRRHRPEPPPTKPQPGKNWRRAGYCKNRPLAREEGVPQRRRNDNSRRKSHAAIPTYLHKQRHTTTRSDARLVKQSRQPDNDGYHRGSGGERFRRRGGAGGRQFKGIASSLVGDKKKNDIALHSW